MTLRVRAAQRYGAYPGATRENDGLETRDYGGAAAARLPRRVSGMVPGGDTHSDATTHSHGCEGGGGEAAYAAANAQFMGELTAQVRISEFSNCKTWYENKRVCGMSQFHKLARFRTRLYS